MMIMVAYLGLSFLFAATFTFLACLCAHAQKCYKRGRWHQAHAVSWCIFGGGVAQALIANLDVVSPFTIVVTTLIGCASGLALVHFDNKRERRDAADT